MLIQHVALKVYVEMSAAVELYRQSLWAFALLTIGTMAKADAAAIREVNKALPLREPGRA